MSTAVSSLSQPGILLLDRQAAANRPAMPNPNPAAARVAKLGRKRTKKLNPKTLERYRQKACASCLSEVTPVPGSFCVRGRTEHSRSLTAAADLGCDVCVAELHGAPFSADDVRAHTHAGFAVQVTGGVQVIPHDSCAARYANHSNSKILRCVQKFGGHRHQRTCTSPASCLPHAAQYAKTSPTHSNIQLINDKV